ncbi:MAG: thioredoxin domain-containing protein [Anaerolineales bacterium]|nr:thioredoxin domain-containing protein [Anaerolineales bacterium]MDW8161030.1 thioredoxin domain-containing protein [Anaerolineales bacterium]
MVNRLVESNSPYLLQHAHNPVDWYPWGEEAFEKAKREDKPIFLSIGYASCHWCHVMAHESFEDEKVAEYLNQHFVSIKVDREERPDVDSIYMNAVVALTGHGGWPLSVFLTPEGKPFFGGTYYPPTPRYRLPSFMDVLRAVQEVWTNKRQQVEEATEQIFSALQLQYQKRNQPRTFDSRDLENATDQMLRSYDWQYGGWGKAPKFPQSIALEFLLHHYAKNPGRDQLRELIEHALERMSRGGMYDLIEGGFCRYSTDARWMVPHFEKMLYDNAQLGLVYLYGYVTTQNENFKEVVQQTVDFLFQNLLDSSGLFYSSLDADSEGEEGKYYTFTLQELRETLDAAEYELFSMTHHLSPLESNPQQMVFQPIEKLSADNDQYALIKSIYDKLRKLRSTKVRPNVDDKCILSWNSLVLRFFAEASKYLQSEHFLSASLSLASAIKEWYLKDHTLYRIKRGSTVSTPALLEDYATTIDALLSLYEVSGETAWFTLSKSLAELMVAKFTDPNGGFYDVSSEHDHLILKPKELQDTATPSANALALRALMRLSVMEGKYLDWYDQFISFIQSNVENALRYPLSFSSWLMLMDMILAEPREAVLIGSRNELAPFFKALWSKLRGNFTVCYADPPTPVEAPPILKNRTKINHRPTAYICHLGVCKNPTTDPQEFDKMLSDERYFS